ncbi:MAG: 50S ribosomal protein L33 [Vampirovibrionales bacterium]
MGVITKKRKIILACADCQSRNYSSFKNASNHPERLELYKFCRKCNTHTLHKETK